MELPVHSKKAISLLPVQYGEVNRTPARAPGLQTFPLRVFKALLLLSAATLFTLVPTSWSLLRSQRTRTPTSLAIKNAAIDPSAEWNDDIWPIRPPTPWDISVDFPYPRILEYDVQEGTWLRLDVHPKTGDIVFDMLGDLYCLPAESYSQDSLKISRVSEARPILLGVPHDADPHFSSEGDRIVFRSDAELGVDNIWVLRWTGCDEMDLRDALASDQDGGLMDFEADLLSRGVKETTDRKRRRLMREGRLGARRVTNETYRYISDARFHPSISKVVATKWYTSERSLGAGEGWEYRVPTLGEIDKAECPIETSGRRLLGRSLPFGWSPEQYGDQQIGPEQFIWRGEDSLIYAMNERDANTFTYSKDVHNGIYAIFSRNLTTNRTETLVDSFPGGASRPELSRDRRTLAFVRRVRDKEALVLKDLITGTLHHVWHGLTYDASAISAPMGTYPSFSFTPSDDAVVIWASGQIYFVPLSVNGLGEKVSSSIRPIPIRFTARIKKRLAETRRAEMDLVGLETQQTQRVYAFKELRVDDTGNRAVFQGAGVTFVHHFGTESTVKVPILHEDRPYYSPSFVHGADDFVLHSRWSDEHFTTFELSDLGSGVAHELAGLSLGRYYSPILCECPGANRQLAFIKTGGDLLTGNVVATASPGLYLGDITLPPVGSGTSQTITVRNLRFVSSEIDIGTPVQLRFVANNSKLLVQQSNNVFAIDLAAAPKENGRYTHHKLASGKMSKELVVSPRISRDGKVVTEHVAFIEFYHVYFVPGLNIGEDPVWSKPSNATKGLARLSLDGGHDVTWSRDGKKVFWFLGPYLHSLEVSKLRQCSSSIENDPLTFGISCVKHLVQYQAITVEHSTDIQRLKRDALAFSPLRASSRESANADVLVITNATILSMERGNPASDLLHSGVLVTRGGVIESVGSAQSTVIPQGATIIDAQGGFVVPGFIDIHAHWSGWDTLYPAKSWEHETFLAYGVTTVHNPSEDNVAGFVERSRLERGQFIGPRIFHVGNIIYGAGSEDHQDISDSADAYSALVRIKAEGGPASTSYKNYNLPSRASRQRLLLAARNISMLCFPEGGMNFDWDLTYIVDGMTTVEHALPVPKLYDDVLILHALSGTGSTPTHIVNYGGAWGEQYVWAQEDLPNDPKLRRFTRHDILEGLSESTARPKDSYALFNTSASVAKMVHQGLRTHIGAHGEPPLGLNYHAEMFFTQQGGLSNYEVLQAATVSAAITLGIYSSVGTLSSGKLADFLVYPPGVHLLNDDIQRTRDLLYVVRGGRMWNASTMEEVWPIRGKRQRMPPFNAE